MKLKQFRYSSDNLGYVVYGDREAIAIDGGAVDQIQNFIKNMGLLLRYATNTHSHPDHTIGTSELVKTLDSEYLNYNLLMKKQQINIEDKQIRILPTPGHTPDSVSFYTGTYLITGDTLFNGTVGNCFSGDLDGFYKSIKLLLSCPGNTMVYAGHDYFKESIEAAREFEPDNPDFDDYIQKYDPDNVHSALGDEYKVNPYIRFNEQPIIELLKRKGLPVDTEIHRWYSVMTL